MEATIGRLRGLRKNKHRHIGDIGVYAYLRALFFEHDAEFERGKRACETPKGHFWTGTN